MSDFVLDASVALAWILDNPIAPYATAVRRALASGKRGLVPALWHLEVANGLATAMRRRDLIVTDLDDGLTTIQETVAQAIDTEMNFIPAGEALANARAFQLTAYDAVYLDLARRERLPLATLDKSLRAAAARAGVNAMS
jgi:predicted nucleic acid-binding protein